MRKASLSGSSAARLVLLSLALVTAGGCLRDRYRDESAAKTDLGAQGNADVRDRLAAYVAKDGAAHCNDSGTGARVIYSGFSVFQTFPYNV